MNTPEIPSDHQPKKLMIPAEMFPKYVFPERSLALTISKISGNHHHSYVSFTVLQ